MINEILKKLIKGKDLSDDEAFRVMDRIMAGELSDIEIASYLTALQCKGEVRDEIMGSCRAIRNHCNRVNFKDDYTVDTCGTGGDGQGTFNISTVSAFVVAGAGVPVAKHGNRAVSGSCGSADLMEELGVDINMSPEKAARSLKENNMAFLFAPVMHPAMANVASVRRKLQLRTIFNILGPLNNPAFVKRQVIGVFDKNLSETIVHVLQALGSSHVMAVSGEDGGDEISLSSETNITELKDGKIFSYTLNPEELGFQSCSLSLLRGGDVGKNRRICLSVLNGEISSYRDAVLINAGAAIYVSGKAKDIKEGIKAAVQSIDSNKALEVLQKLK